MTEQNDKVETSDTASVVSPGELIKAAREKAGLTPEQLAKKVNLRITLVQELENNHFDTSISPTFTRGYLKLLAKNLDIEESSLLEGYDQLNIKHKPSTELQSFSRRTTHEANDNKLMIISYGIAVVLIALAVVWWLQQDSSIQPLRTVMPKEEQSQPVKIEKPQQMAEQVNPQAEAVNGDEEANSGEEVAAPVEPVIEQQASELNQDNAPVDVDNGSATDQVQQSEQLNTVDNPQQDTLAADDQTNSSDEGVQEELVDTQAADEPVIDNTDAGLNQPVETVENTTPAVEYSEADFVDMELTFSRDCWVSLRDARGEEIAYGIKASGYVMNVSGVPPVDVTLCAPEFVTVSFDGESIDMSQFRQGRTARFELPLEQN